MNSVQRERAQMILRNWSDVEAVEDAKALLQELVDAPAPSVPDEQLQAAFDRGLKAGNEQGIAQTGR